MVWAMKVAWPRSGEGQLSLLPSPPPSPPPPCRYLSEQHDATTIGVLLGAAATHRGSGDPRVSKMLLLHVPATHPDSFPELELSPLVQVGGG